MNETLARAKLYGVCSLAFVYPEDRVVDRIRDETPSLTEALEVANADLETMGKGLAFLISATATPPALIRRNYDELFVGVKQCSLDESEYDKSIFYRHQRIADVAGFYRAFGFEIASDSNQRPDFVGTEMEFMSVLLLKQAYAVEQGWDDKAEACRDAEGKFYHEHLEWWIPSVCEKLRGASSCDFYRALSDFLESFIRSEGSRYLQPA